MRCSSRESGAFASLDPFSADPASARIDRSVWERPETIADAVRQGAMNTCAARGVRFVEARVA
jgi:hypothetical protein